jgi:hypothetical protein
MLYVNEPELMTLLLRFQNFHDLPGLDTEESRERFVRKVVNSEIMLRAFAMKRFSGSATANKELTRSASASRSGSLRNGSYSRRQLKCKCVLKQRPSPLIRLKSLRKSHPP